MKKLLGVLVLLACAGGCFFEEREPHHGRVAAYERDHNHCDGCGHVQVRGVWYVRD